MAPETETNIVKYTVSLKGLHTPSGSITFGTLREIIHILSEGSERALRLALEGASVKRGNAPAWLEKSTDFVLRGLKKGSTVLEIEAPTLGSVAEEQIRQPDLWNRVPSAAETALTILAKSVRDAEQEILESDRYDRGVLETLLDFKRLLDGRGLRVELSSKERRSDRFHLDAASYQKMQRIRSETPEPQAVVLTGFLNMIQHSRRRFELTLEDGHAVRGRVHETFINLEQIRPLWGKKVTIKGTLQYTPSKKPRFLEAEVIAGRQSGDEVFSTLPLAFRANDVLIQAQKGVTSQNIVSEIWGQWPGNEPIDELLDNLNDLDATK